MSPSDYDRLEKQDTRLVALETQAALDKQSRQAMHRQLGEMTHAVSSLAADFKQFLSDYHENKTAAAVAAKVMESALEKIEALEVCKAEKTALEAAGKALEVKVGEMADRQEWALRGALTALVAALMAVYKGWKGS